MTTLEAGDTLDHYRLDAEVAHSGMSTLYRATDLRNGRHGGGEGPAPGDGSRSGAAGALPARGGDRAGLLDHPGIVKTFDGEERSRLYMVH